LVGRNDQSRQTLGLANILKAPNVAGDILNLSALNVVIRDEDPGYRPLLDESSDFGDVLKTDYEPAAQTLEAVGIGSEDLVSRENLERALRRCWTTIGGVRGRRVRYRSNGNAPPAMHLAGVASRPILRRMISSMCRAGARGLRRSRAAVKQKTKRARIEIRNITGQTSCMTLASGTKHRVKLAFRANALATY
jgi:hypothetical protein